MKNDVQELRVKISGLTEENKRYVIAVAEALLFAQGNAAETKEQETVYSVCKKAMKK